MSLRLYAGLRVVVICSVLPALAGAAPAGGKVTLGRADIKKMAGMWIASTQDFTPLVGAQYPDYKGNAWDYGIARDKVSGDGDIHVNMAVDADGTGKDATCCATGDSPVVTEVINANEASLDHIKGLSGEPTCYDGVFRFRVGKTCTSCTVVERPRKFEIHPATKLLVRIAATWELNTDYTSSIAEVDDARDHPQAVLQQVFDDVYTATAGTSNPQVIEFDFPNPCTNYVEYTGIAESDATTDSLSPCFVFHPTGAMTKQGAVEIMTTATARVRLIPGSSFSAEFCAVKKGQKCRVNGITRTDMAEIDRAVSNLGAGKSVTRPLAVELACFALGKP